MTYRVSACLLAGLAFLAAFPEPEPPRLSACAVAPMHNQTVAIAHETAIIIWDAASGTEHFIRRASFNTAAKDFGFLVPAPTKPELGEVDDSAFTELARITAPKIVTRQRESSSGGCNFGCSKATREFAAGSAAPKSVEVLEEAQVAGYDYAVLEADNADALGKWLTEHKYEFSPALKDWADIYIKKGWKLTAFKIAKKTDNSPAVSSKAVRLTFKTDLPFYPYREPVSSAPAKPNVAANRLLRVFFIGDQKVMGTVGKETGKTEIIWPAQLVWANAIQPPDREGLLKLLNVTEKTPASWWLTEFEDRSSPRPVTDDIYFGKAIVDGPVERPPQIQYVSNNRGGALMFGAMGLCLAVPCVWSRLRRNSK